MFKIKPLVWVKSYCDFTAKTIFGSIRIDAKTNTWRYCFQEYYDEGEYTADCIEGAKAAVFKFYLGRLRPALVKQV